MDFLKILGLIIGTGSVAGTAGIVIHYADNIETPLSSEEMPAVIDRIVHIKRNIHNTQRGKVDSISDQNFDGKIIFYKKSGTGASAIYEVKLMSKDQYKTKKDEFNKNKLAENKYKQVHKVIDITGNLNSGKVREKLREIFKTSPLLSNIKLKISEKEKELKEFLGNDNYENLKNIS